MKASKTQQNHTPSRPFHPKPLSVEQENAIDLLLTGKPDREVAEIVGVTRWTVQVWRTSHPLFMATLHQQRETLFSGAVDRMRAMLTKALENIQGAIEGGDVSASFALVKTTGLHGFCPPTGEMNVQKIFDDEVMRQLAQMKIPDKYDILLDPLKNPLREQRKAEIEAELMREYGEPE